MSLIASRHEGTLGGALGLSDECTPIPVRVVVNDRAAHLSSVQHCTWMLVNLLCRMEGVVSAVHVLVPPGVPQRGRVVPLADPGLDFGSALTDAAARIGIVPFEKDGDACVITFVIGPGPAVSGDVLRVIGSGWVGGYSTAALYAADSSLPFGPYIGACLASAEVFRRVRAKADAWRSTPSIFYSAWSHTVSSSSDLLSDGERDIAPPALQCALSGVGAVGSAWAHALWAVEGARGRIELIDNDEKGVDESNLNRYVLFGRDHVGREKAFAAAAVLADCEIAWNPHQADIGVIALDPRGPVISAVDTNEARAAIQQKYGRRVIGGSTLDLRSEILRVGPPGRGACLRCYNPPRELKSDAELRQQVLEMSGDELASIAAGVKVSPADLTEWAQHGRCGHAGERVLPLLRGAAGDPPQFAVGFVSAFTGTLLASETLKSDLPRAGVLRDDVNRAVFQFLNPFARTNRASFLGRDPRCPMCVPDSEATRIWQSRFYSNS